VRPDYLVVVVGTGTEVGKTWVGAAVLAELVAAGRRVAARKPVQSFASDAGPTDAEVLAAATGELAMDVCPPNRCYPIPLAPPMAARVLRRPSFGLAELVAELSWPDGVEVGWVETVGGPRSPIAGNGNSAAFAAALDPDLLVLVADARLGAINAVLLSVTALHARPVVILNRDDGSEVCALNRAWLESEDLDIATSPHDVARRIHLALRGNR
jgi:dethiobiotin synthetase